MPRNLVLGIYAHIILFENKGTCWLRFAKCAFAIPHVQEAWMTKSADPDVRTAAKAYFTMVDVIAEKQAKAFEEGVTSTRVIRLRGMHYIFGLNESDVLREMRAFLGSLC